MQAVIDILSWIFIIGGSFFAIVGAVGLVRFPDFWSRLHAVSVTDSAGVILLIVGMALQAGLTLVTVKLLLILAFLFITGPTSTHAVANAALVSGLKPRSSVDRDDADAATQDDKAGPT
ncbi:multisubunit sodium/proton antiporter, MrpG subunit [Sedimentitalea nanhaiensis]|uniref:Multisubunit sodium/proton antiporter, MrpG subunit n=2 Tax=Sedimentitalea nanhaiensis TaxID=999627 RepID=A0A1I7B368_9RHOB|nr:multisubunit sodium/proton antiporter, MrpG subunit [Sedimentitalea nanhaiensis]